MQRVVLQRGPARARSQLRSPNPPAARKQYARNEWASRDRAALAWLFSDYPKRLGDFPLQE